MQVHRGTAQLPRFQQAVITIGTFDGVHCGHQKIIEALKAEAARLNGETVIITFDPHPRKVLQPATSLQLLNTLPEKIELLTAAGINHLVVVPFTPEFGEQPAEEYVEKFLVNNFQPAVVIIGYDHRFGKNRSGDFALLSRLADKFSYRLVEIPKQVLNEIAVSSTKIRHAVLQSDVNAANKLLGYNFFFEGVVEHGDQLGRTIGFPTANLAYTSSDKIHLGHGVYAVDVERNGRQLKGMLSIGTRPTLEKSEEKVEVNLFDFSEEIYGERLRVTVVAFLRPQEKYPSLEVMTAQLYRDKEASLALL